LRGSEGAAGQATLKEAAVAKKKKRAEKAQRRQEKEKEIARWVRAGENRSNVEAELESEEPMEMGGDTGSSEEEGDRGVVATSVESHEPAVVSTSGGRDAEWHSDVPISRKHAASSDTAVEQEAKQARSPRPLEASLASPPTALSVAGHAGRSKELARTPASLGSVHARDPQWGDAPSVAPVGVP